MENDKKIQTRLGNGKYNRTAYCKSCRYLFQRHSKQEPGEFCHNCTDKLRKIDKTTPLLVIYKTLPESICYICKTTRQPSRNNQISQHLCGITHCEYKFVRRCWVTLWLCLKLFKLPKDIIKIIFIILNISISKK